VEKSESRIARRPTLRGFVVWGALLAEHRGESDFRHCYGCMSRICVAMYHLFPKLSCTAALRSP
jgi:hypothetical protein